MRLRYYPDWGVALRYWPEIAHGLVLTFRISLLAFLLALVLGLPLGLCRLSKNKIAQRIASVFIEILRGTPEMVQLLWLYYVLPMVLRIPLTDITTGVLMLGISLTAYMAEVYRSGISSVTKGQIEAAKALGMSQVHTLSRIVIPQAMRVMIPPMLNNYVLVLKRVSLLMAIGVPELMYSSQRISSVTYRPLEVLSFAALLYVAVTYPATLLVRRLETRVSTPM